MARNLNEAMLSVGDAVLKAVPPGEESHIEIKGDAGMHTTLQKELPENLEQGVNINTFALPPIKEWGLGENATSEGFNLQLITWPRNPYSFAGDRTTITEGKMWPNDIHASGVFCEGAFLRP